MEEAVVAEVVEEEAGRGRRGRGRGGRGNTRSAFDASNPGRYYPYEEWITLSEEEKTRSRAAREDRRRNTSALEQDTTTNQPPDEQEDGRRTRQRTDECVYIARLISIAAEVDTEVTCLSKFPPT